MLVGSSKFLKQIIQIKPNRVKNPNWPEANQLAIYKSVIWTQGYCEQIQLIIIITFISIAQIQLYSFQMRLELRA